MVGRTLNKPVEPAKKGYDFAGWYKDSACTVRWNFDTGKVAGNMTLYAKWELKSGYIGWKTTGLTAGVSIPQGIAADAQGNVYVADTGNHRVVKLSAAGKLLLEIGYYGTEAGKFNTPAGLAVDSSENLYVADNYNPPDPEVCFGRHLHYRVGRNRGGRRKILLSHGHRGGSPRAGCT